MEPRIRELPDGCSSPCVDAGMKKTLLRRRSPSPRASAGARDADHHLPTTIPPRRPRQRRRRDIFVRTVAIIVFTFLGGNCLMGHVLVTPGSSSSFAIDYSDALAYYLHRKTTTLWTPTNIDMTIRQEEEGNDDEEPMRILNMERQRRTTPRSAHQLLRQESNTTDNLLHTGPLYGEEATRIPVDATSISDWSVLCRNAGLNKTSRVAIWGILTQPPGLPLVLLIAKHCGVRHVLGVDSMFPNHQITRLEQMQDYRELKRTVPHVRLLVPSSAMELHHHDSVVQGLVDFRPTHVVSIMTFPSYLQSVMAERDGRFYNVKSGLLSLYTMLLAMENLTASQHLMPMFLHVTSSDSKRLPWTMLPSILLQSTVDVNVTQLQLPYLFGPMVSPLADVRHMSPNRRMYVDDAVASILLALDPATYVNLTSTFIRLNAYSAASASTADTELLDALYANETRSWLNNFATPQLGNSVNSGKYVDFYGLRRTTFPCASRCDSLQCAPTMWDTIIDASRNATEGCRAVMYVANFSSALQDLPVIESATGRSSLGAICRIAFVSKSSALVKMALKEVLEPLTVDDGEIDSRDQQRDQIMLATTNGLRLGDWNIVWTDRDETTISDLEISLLRIDPSALFAKSVDRALFAESNTMMHANDQRLERLFKKIWLTNSKARTIHQYDEEARAWRLVTIKAQKRRRAIIFAREPEEQINFDSFIAKTGSSVISRQREYYEQSAAIIMSQDGRTKKERQKAQFDTFPYQWIEPSFILHELSMSFSQDFRCDWMKEYLFWGGEGRDASMMSFAYSMGKRIVEGLYTSRLDDGHDSSWFALVRKGTDTRISNRRAEEIFVRIMPRNATDTE